MNRELCMLATNFNPGKHRVAGMYLSEKLDGMRCLWLPHTKGKPVREIPFANMEKDKREHVASGLWSRYGKVIHCPEGWTDNWPNFPLDGELYIGRNSFQPLMSAVKTLIPDRVAWSAVRFMVFDSPTYRMIFQNGRINNTNFKHTMNYERMMKAIGNPNDIDMKIRNFDFNYRIMQRDLEETPSLVLHEQKLLPFSTEPAIAILTDALEKITEEGGEGLMLRHPASEWEPIRSEYLLKVKKLHDAEATVVGYRMGQGKYLGMLGSLTVNFGGTEFELSGFTDEERTLTLPWAEWGTRHPGALWSDGPDVLAVSPSVSTVFPLGTVVTFRYRELTDDGIPKEARYLRKHGTA